MEKTNSFNRFDELIVSELRSSEGESILWKGKPTDIKIMEAPYGNIYILRWLICLLLFACVLWYQLIYMPSNSMTTNSLAIPIVCTLAILFIAVKPLIDINSIQRKCVYCITTKRVIVSNVSNPLKMKAKSFEEVDDISIEMISDNRGTIYIGKKQKNSVRRSRTDSLVFPTSNDDEEFAKRPLIFYSIEAPKNVMTYFPALKQ